MRRKLTKTGNSLALVLDRSLLARAKIDADTPLDVTTDGHVIVIAPARRRSRAAKLARIMEKTDHRYGRTFKRLAE
ncbi:MAG: AbrB/MazE/SpoVT family DNA-binding domain-containing protein [Candidatus Rokubacteria bacterium]|nr:AbrB/MazE/SpoVT family DNA-binding domain-containing protein [Candidatus Rokubacteria bacterium]